MIKRGEKYREDIKILKSLRLKDREAYNSVMKKICEDYNISSKTIYRDMKKKYPGIRKIRSDRGTEKAKPTIKEVRIINEVIKSGKRLNEAKEITEKLTGKKISYKKLVKARKKSPKIKISQFGKDFKNFIEKYFETENIGIDKGINVRIKEKAIFLDKGDIEDITMILINAFNRSAFADEHKLKLDRTELRRAMLLHLIEQQIEFAKENSDYKMVEAITRMQERFESDRELSSDFAVFEKCIREFKPDISKTELINLIKKYS